MYGHFSVLQLHRLLYYSWKIIGYYRIELNLLDQFLNTDTISVSVILYCTIEILSPE